MPPTPVVIAAGVLLVVVELALAVTPWVPRLRVAGTVLAAGFHLAAVPLVGVEPVVALRLVVFGGLAVLLHAASAGLVEGQSDAGPCGPWSGRERWGRVGWLDVG